MAGPGQKISQPKNEPAIKSYHHEKNEITKGISYLRLMMLIVPKIFFIATQIYFPYEVIAGESRGEY